MKTNKVIPLTLGLSAAFAVAGSDEVVAPASSGWVGDFTLGLSHTDLQGDEANTEESDDFAAINFELQLGRDYGDYFLQFDLFGEHGMQHDDDTYDQGIGLAVHAMRQTEYGGIGGFTGILHTKQDNDSSETSLRWFGGVEAQIDGNFADYYIQTGLLLKAGGDDASGDDSIRDAVFLRVAAEKELSGKFGAVLDFNAASGEMDDDDENVTLLGVGAGLNYQLTDTLVAGLNYDLVHYRHEEGVMDEFWEHSVGLSLTYSFGSGSNVTDLSTPRFLRWVGLTGGQLE